MENPLFVQLSYELRLRFHSFLFRYLRVQDHPEHGVLYLVRGLLNMVQDYTWEESSDAKVRVYISALPLLAAMSQETYLYTVPKSESTLSVHHNPLQIRWFVCTVRGDSYSISYLGS